MDSTLSDSTGRVDPEDLRSYEAGFKWRAQDGRRSEQRPIFHDYENLQQKSSGSRLGGWAT